MTPDHVAKILKNLLEGYDSVVIDAGAVLDERSMTALEAAEAVMLPVYPEIAALPRGPQPIDYFNDVGSITQKSTFVLNNVFAKDILKPRDVESALGSKVGAELPYDPFLYLKAVNEGIPMVIGAPKSAPADRLNKLSMSAFGEDGYSVPDGVGERKSGRFGIRRRA